MVYVPKKGTSSKPITKFPSFDINEYSNSEVIRNEEENELQ